MKTFKNRGRAWLAMALSLCMLASVALLGCTQEKPVEQTPPPAADTPAQAEQSEYPKTIVDLAGRSIEFAAPVERVVAIAGPSYEKVFLLGQAHRLAGAHFYMVERPWVVATNPTISSVAPISSPGEPNVEGLLELEADAVLFWDYEEPLKSMEAVGLPVVVVQQPSGGNPTTVDEFIAYQKKEVQTFADVFGGTAQSNAQKWFDYFDQKVAFVQGRVGTIPEAERKTAIYAYGEEGLGLFSQYSYVSFWLELAGGKNLADETGAEMDTVVTMEQIVAWNPDYIFAGRMDATETEAITQGAAWAELGAVKGDKVIACPDGVMYWDYSSEGVLLMEYLAQKMYPELFADLDMVKEVQDYYQTFYNYTLSDENAQRLLDHLPPA